MESEKIQHGYKAEKRKIHAAGKIIPKEMNCVGSA